MWRTARTDDDDAIVEMCLSLNREDPWPEPVTVDQVRRTLAALRAEPWRGRAVIAEIDGQVAGYALLIAFWSNEFGGEVCVVDEIYVQTDFRGRGIGRSLFDALRGGHTLWPGDAVAIGLEVTTGNARARDWYRRLGFGGSNTVLHLRRERRS
jgi:ribosomal protein S18 acetylase RimI-like enzyme